MSSFYVHKGRNHWYVIEEIWEEGKKKHLTVPKIAYTTLGFHIEMTLNEARLRVKQLNSSKSIERKKAATTARRIELIKLVESVYVPKLEATEFTDRLQRTTFGNEIHEKKLLSHWKFVQVMVTDLRIDPKDYSRNAEFFYKYFIERKMSLDYSKKILRIVNMWGNFVCYKYGQFFSNIPTPKGRVKEIINDAYIDGENYVGESNPLTPQLLSSKKDLLKDNGNYEWLFISMWFGLRPIEIDALKDSKKYRIEHSEKKILWVYQTKLTSISRDKRWKGIPILYPEQELALTLVENGNFKRPILKVMRNVFGEQLTLYAGRKNFEDMMLDKGHRLEDISMWMGHQNIQTTWSKYRNRKRVGGFKIGSN